MSNLTGINTPKDSVQQIVDALDTMNLAVVNAVNNIKEYITLNGGLLFNVSSGNTYYFINTSTTGPNTYANLVSTFNGIIKKITLHIGYNASLSNEAVSFYIRINQVDNLIQTVNTPSRYSYITLDTNLSVYVNDYIEFKMVCPSWTTPPTAVHIHWNMLIQKL